MNQLSTRIKGPSQGRKIASSRKETQLLSSSFILYLAFRPRKLPYSTLLIIMDMSMLTAIIPSNTTMSNITVIDSSLGAIVAPTFDIAGLHAAPQAALLLQSLSILAACTFDASLENPRTASMIRHLKTSRFLSYNQRNPLIFHFRSFRGSLYQVSTSMSDAFRTADHAMMRIKINLDEVPEILNTLVTAYVQPEDIGSKFISNLQMKNFKEIVEICSHEAEEVRNRFNDTLQLIRELIQVTSSTVGENEENVRNINITMATNDRTKKELEEHNRMLEEKLKRDIAKTEEMHIEFDEASRRLTSDVTLIQVAILDIFKSIPNVFGAKLSSSIEPYEKEARLRKEMAVEAEKNERETMDKYKSNRMELASLADKILRLEVDKLNMTEVLEYLGEGVNVLGDIEQQWGQLKFFFEKLRVHIMDPLSRHLKDFDAIVEQKQLRDSGIARNQLAKSGIWAAGYCLNVRRCAIVYGEVSRRYVMPQVDTAVKKMILTKEEARELAGRMRNYNEDVSKESDEFIKQKLNETWIEAQQHGQTVAESFRDALKKQAKCPFLKVLFGSCPKPIEMPEIPYNLF